MKGRNFPVIERADAGSEYHLVTSRIQHDSASGATHRFSGTARLFRALFGAQTESFYLPIRLSRLCCAQLFDQ